MESEHLEHELRERGLITHEGGGTLGEILARPRTVYLGIDPTATSLHLGHLVPVILLRHLARAGHTPWLLVGGGTALIGDPRESGERPFSDAAVVAKNAEAVKRQLERILQIDSIPVVDNATWLHTVPLIDFLRDIGKHFTVNQLIKRDIIKRRLETDEDSISYTEFSYSLLQAYDYLHLYEHHAVDLQIGGSDQWANIISGVDLVRRKHAASVYALTTPIVTDKTTGKKFGKSEGNAVWLDPDQTSPFSFYQFWINVSDENASDYLKLFSFLPLTDIARLLEKHTAEPHERYAQRALAKEVTAFVHGEEVAVAAENVSELLYGKKPLATLNEADRALLIQELPHTKVAVDTSIVDALVSIGLAGSKAEARRLIEAGGVSLNGAPVTLTTSLTPGVLQQGIALLKKGKSYGLLLM